MRIIHVGGEGGRVAGVGEQVGHVTVERGVWTCGWGWGWGSDI